MNSPYQFYSYVKNNFIFIEIIKYFWYNKRKFFLELIMGKYLVIDSRMRKVEKDLLRSLGYRIIQLKENKTVYYEISSHVDIFLAKIKDKIIAHKSVYGDIKEKIGNGNIFLGQTSLEKTYPLDIAFNVCNIGEFVIHNFRYTDKKVLDVIEKMGLEKINISQGYSNCSIAVIDENSCIVTDKKIYEILIKYGIDVLYLEYIPDIKLIGKEGCSNMKGFIGGAISKIGDNIVIFGDLNKIDLKNKIRSFIISKNLNLIDFKDLDVIDYGGILEV